MAWTWCDFFDCFAYGKVFQIRQIKNFDGGLVCARLHRKKDGKLSREIKTTTYYLHDLPDGVTPSVFDFIFYNPTDRSPSLLKMTGEIDKYINYRKIPIYDKLC